MIIKISIAGSYSFDEFQIGRFLSRVCLRLQYISDDNLVKYVCENIIHIFSFISSFGYYSL